MHNFYDEFGGCLTLEHNQLGLQDPFILQDFQKKCCKSWKKNELPWLTCLQKKDVGLSWSLVAMVFPWLFGCFLAAASRAQQKVAATNHNFEASKLRLCSSWMARQSLILYTGPNQGKFQGPPRTWDPHPYHSQSRIPWSMGMVWEAYPLEKYGGMFLGSSKWRQAFEGFSDT